MNALLGKLVDGALDRTIIGGYTSVGYRIRSRRWEEPELLDMAGKSVLVTGATSGLGLAAATGFARLGASVTLLARDVQRGQDARSVVAEHAAGQSPDQVTVEKCDLSDLGSVRRFAQRFSARAQRLDVVVHNAGVMTRERELSVDGLELTFATNVLGPFLLTHLLLDLLKRSAPARVISVSSGGMYTQRIHADDLQTEYDDFDGPTAYAREQAGRGDPDRDVVTAARGHRCGRALDASGLGGYARRRGLAAAVLQTHQATPTDSGSGRRHDRLARRGRRARAQHRRLLARPQAPSHASAPLDP